MIDNVPNSNDISVKGALADDDANLMIKMKFLTYKVHVLWIFIKFVCKLPILQ